MDKLKGHTNVTLCNNQDVSTEGTFHHNVNVYIWDMDETLILLKSLLDGSFAEAFSGSKDVKKGVEIGKHWENYILRVCDELFYYEQIENYNEPFLGSLREYDDGRDLSDYDFTKDSLALPCDDLNKRKLAYRHRVIAEKYSGGLKSMLDEGKIKLWDDLYDLTDSYTDGWLSSARALLEHTSNRTGGFKSVVLPSRSTANSTDQEYENVNLLVTSGSLIPSLVKCLLYRLDGLISHENVYSSWDVGKLQCFQWIKERFGGPGVRFCVIGDGLEECAAAERMKWPFVRIDIQPNGTHRFPGLTKRMLGYYMDIIYRTSKVENDNDEKS